MFYQFETHITATKPKKVSVLTTRNHIFHPRATANAQQEYELQC